MANNELLTYGCIYRSPNSHDANNESLNNLIYELDQVKSAYKLLVGDFNFRSICWEDGIAISTTESTFVHTLQDTYMAQHVAEPTRGRNGQEPSILDLIISNDPNIVSHISYESPLGKSDHACQTFYLKCYRNKPDQTRKFYLYDKGDFNQIMQTLSTLIGKRKLVTWLTQVRLMQHSQKLCLLWSTNTYPQRLYIHRVNIKTASARTSSDQLRRNTDPGKGTWKLAPGKST